MAKLPEDRRCVVCCVARKAVAKKAAPKKAVAKKSAVKKGPSQKGSSKIGQSELVIFREATSGLLNSRSDAPAPPMMKRWPMPWT